MPDLLKPGQSAALWCEICLSWLLGPNQQEGSITTILMTAAGVIAGIVVAASIADLSFPDEGTRSA